MSLKFFALALLLVFPTSVFAAGPQGNGGYDIGVVTKPAGKGLEVLAVTPGGGSERLGLRVGDHVVSVNGKPLDAGNPVLALQQAVEASGGKARIQAIRNGSQLTLEGQFATATEPARGCGYVTTAMGVVPESQGIFQAFITQIDGHSTPLSGRSRYQLPAGRHVLTIAEVIKPSRLNNSQQLQIAKMKRNLDARAYKAFVVDVRPNTSYRIGTRLLRAKLDVESIRNNGYWEPVVWSSVPEKCY